jgi:hypothetical protein
MSFADKARVAVERSQGFNEQRINDKAMEIAEAFVAKINHPDSRSLGTLSPDGKSFSCIAYCTGMEVAEMRAVAARLREDQFGFKVEAVFDYHQGDRIIISI